MAAVVILVQVGDQQIVNARQVCVAYGGHDPVRIAAHHPRITRVDEQRLPRRRDDERGLTAFDVDEVEVERPLPRGARRREAGHHRNRARKCRRQTLHQ